MTTGKEDSDIALAGKRCRCERCCPENPAPTYTRAFIVRCLAEQIAALPTVQERRARLAKWAGCGIEEELREAVRAAFERRGGAPAVR